MFFSQGIDIVSVARIKAAIENGGSRFLERVFTPAERKYCRGRPRVFEHYAVRFAAKEAFLKALGDRASAIRLNQIEVAKRPSGKPVMLMMPEAACTVRSIARVSRSGPEIPKPEPEA